MATKQQIDKCLAALAVAYPHYDKQQANPDFARQIFHRILQDIHGALLEAATMQWLSMARPFHPTPGELRDMALALITRCEPSADEAWSEVLKQRHDAGYYGVPQWSTERIARTIEAFGRWKDFCLIETSQEGIIRAQFMRIYEAQTKRAHDGRLMLPEVQNAIAQLADGKRLALQEPSE